MSAPANGKYAFDSAQSCFSKVSRLQAKGVISVFHDVIRGVLRAVHAPYPFLRFESSFTVSMYQAIEPWSIALTFCSTHAFS